MFGIHVRFARARARRWVCALLGPRPRERLQERRCERPQEGTGTPPVPARPLPRPRRPRAPWGTSMGPRARWPRRPTPMARWSTSTRSRRGPPRPSPCRPARTWGRAVAAPAHARRARRRRMWRLNPSSRASSAPIAASPLPVRPGMASGGLSGIVGGYGAGGGGMAQASARPAPHAAAPATRASRATPAATRPRRRHRDRGRRLRDDRPALERRRERTVRAVGPRPSAPSPWRPSWPGSIRTPATRRRIAPAAPRSPRSTPRSRADKSPPPYKDLVGDFGARYAPALARPSDGALAVSVDTAARRRRSRRAASMNLRVALVSSDEMPSARAAVGAHRARHQRLDDAARRSTTRARPPRRSSSKLAADRRLLDGHVLGHGQRARPRRRPSARAARRSLARIQRRAAPTAAPTSRRASTSATPRRTTPRIARRRRAHRDAPLRRPRQRRRHRPAAPRRARRAARSRTASRPAPSAWAPTSTRALMSRIADRGAGGYYYLADSSQIAPALAREIDARLQPVATAVELRVRLRPDVAATQGLRLARALGGTRPSPCARRRSPSTSRRRSTASRRPPNRRRRRHALLHPGLRARRPPRHDDHACSCPPGTGERSIASVEVRYKDRLLHRRT